MRSARRRPSQPVDRHSFRMELVLQFEAPVSATQAKEAARRVMDGLSLSSVAPQQGVSPSSCRLVCHDLHRSLSLEDSDISETG